MPRFVVLALVAATAGPGQPEPRLRPPVAVDCPRDHLTSYTGLVVRYRRGADRTDLRIRTDWETIEEVAIAHRGSTDPSRWFLMGGKPFQAADWTRIEERPRRLRAGLRAAAWVCDDGRNPIVDWNPPGEPPGAREISARCDRRSTD